MAKKKDPWVARAERERKLWAKVAKRPVVRLSGVVDAAGPGGGQDGPGEPWVLLLTLVAWRVDGGAVVERAIRVTKKVTPAGLRGLMDSLKPNAVLELKARVLEDAKAGGPAALLERIVSKTAKDPGLAACAARLKKPVVHTDPTFGRLKLDRRVNWFTGKTKWGGKPIEVNLDVERPEDVEAVADVARKLWKDQRAWQKKVREFAVAELLGLKNEHWLRPWEGPVSATQFARRMKLRSITVRGDGSFEFWHDDDMMFQGHSIQVSGDLKTGLKLADIPG